MATKAITTIALLRASFQLGQVTLRISSSVAMRNSALRGLASSIRCTPSVPPSTVIQHSTKAQFRRWSMTGISVPSLPDSSSSVRAKSKLPTSQS